MVHPLVIQHTPMIVEVNFDPTLAANAPILRGYVKTGTLVIQTGTLDGNCVYTEAPKLYQTGPFDCDTDPVFVAPLTATSGDTLFLTKTEADALYAPKI